MEDRGAECSDFDIASPLPYIADVADECPEPRTGYIEKMRAVYDDLMMPIVPALLKGGLKFRYGVSVELAGKFEYLYRVRRTKSD